MLNDKENGIIYAVVPKMHIAYLLASYFFETGVLQEGSKISVMQIPLEEDDEGNVTIQMKISPKEGLN